MAQITYTNKETLNEQPSIADKNKVKAEDMNEIKSVVNTNYGEVGNISSLNTTDKTSVVNAINELKDAEVYSTTEVKTNKVWINGKPIYRKVVDCGLLPNNTSKDVSHNISNLGEIINVNGIINYNNGYYNLFPLYKTSSIAYIDYISTSIFRIKTTQNESNANLKLIVEYTKTTD